MFEKLKRYFFVAKEYFNVALFYMVLALVLLKRVFISAYQHFSRYAFDLALFSLGIVLLLSGAYAEAENPAQLLLFKAVSVSAAIIHAHFAGKLLFPVVDWEATTLAGKHYARISLYFVVTIAYAFGG